mmetsp:Transcript_16466/g.46429  ORF Transcript_16466/g.46429 Transcript_16466/m.46429 type:complete len:203 (+) Transcript_16466:340-948(+)
MRGFCRTKCRGRRLRPSIGGSKTVMLTSTCGADQPPSSLRLSTRRAVTWPTRGRCERRFRYCRTQSGVVIGCWQTRIRRCSVGQPGMLTSRSQLSCTCSPRGSHVIRRREGKETRPAVRGRRCTRAWSSPLCSVAACRLPWIRWRLRNVRGWPTRRSFSGPCWNCTPGVTTGKAWSGCGHAHRNWTRRRGDGCRSTWGAPWL